MMRGFYNGVSGVKTQGFSMDVWSNNIANINNVGFKSSRPEFKTIFDQTMISAGNNPTQDQVGLGATKQTTALNMNTGSFKASERNFDLAIQGKGFFGVRDFDGFVYYTKAGAFDIDEQGNLVDNNGRFVQGTMNALSPINPNQNVKDMYGRLKSGMDPNAQAFSLKEIDNIELKSHTDQTNIKLPNFLYQPAKATTQVDIKGNLDSTIKVENTQVALDKDSFNFDINETEKTISFDGEIIKNDTIFNPKKDDNVIIKIEDKNGKFSEISTQIDENGKWKIDDYQIQFLDLSDLKISAKFQTTQQIPNTQKLSTEIFTPDGDKNLLSINFTKHIPQDKSETIWNAIAKITDKEGNQVATQMGSLVFGSNGTLKSNSLNEINGIKLNFAQLLKANGKDEIYDGIISVMDKGEGFRIKKDGFSDGILKNYHVDDDGNIRANFSNGLMFPIAKLALYHFQNEQGLMKMGENAFRKTDNSGEPFFYKDKAGKVFYGSKIVANMLENSNVDLGQALTEIIVTQKAYDASSKSITTSDQMIQTAIQMKK